MTPQADIGARLPSAGIFSPRQDVLTDDTLEILQYAAAAVAEGISAALVTLVEVHGGAARLPGACMVVLGDGRYCGFVSGGCVEAAAAREALETMTTGGDRVVRFGEGSDYFDIVLPCGGGITLAIHVIGSGLALQQALQRLYGRHAAGLAYDPVRASLTCIPCPAHTGWVAHRFVLALAPRPRLVIFGGSIEAASLVALAHAAGYEVALAGPVGPPPIIDEFTAVVLLFHDLDRELAPLQAALNAVPFYVGALGSAQTHERRACALIALGCRHEDVARIKAPIGIFPKARNASSLALSILADVALAWQQRAIGSPGHALDRRPPSAQQAHAGNEREGVQA